MRFAIVGAGALGSILGAHLTRAGHAVALLARGARARQLAADGLRIHGLVELSARCRVLDDPALLADTDTLIVATKAIDSEKTLAALRHLALANAFSVQNGVLKDMLLAETFGAERVLGCVADFSGELEPDGAVRFTRNVCLHLGELSGAKSARLTELVSSIETAGVHAAAAPDIRSREWSKFVGWIAQLPLAVLTRRRTFEFFEDARSASVMVQIAREAKALADAEGVVIEDASPLPVASIARATEAEAVELVRRVGQQYRERAPEHRMSAQQDALRGSPLEIEETLGFALKRARALSVQLPTLDVCYRILAAAGAASMRPS